jgi:hypothetical protein
VRVASLGPAPHELEDGGIDGGKRLLADHMPVILRPAPQEAVELQDQVPGLGLLVSFHQRTDLVQERLDALLRRRDEQLAVVFTDMLAEEVEALRDVRDDCLLWREFQPSPS